MFFLQNIPYPLLSFEGALRIRSLPHVADAKAGFSRGILTTKSRSNPATAQRTAYAIQSPTNPTALYNVGVSTPAKVAPNIPPNIQTPVAVPIFAGSTHFWITMGPQATTNTNATPSSARDTISTATFDVEPPSKDALQAMTTPTIIMFLDPNLLARNPVGSATTIPTNVKMDINHDANVASIPNCSMMGLIIVGILYWIIVTAFATRNSTNAITIWFWYFALPARIALPFLYTIAFEAGASHSWSPASKMSIGWEFLASQASLGFPVLQGPLAPRVRPVLQGFWELLVLRELPGHRSA